MEHEHKVRETLEYIERNLCDEINLEALAKRAYLSKYHYHRIFHAIVGESVSRYISKRRMAKAAFELTRTDARILDIALKYQYGSQESFTRAFKRVYVLTPGEYRRQYTQCISKNANSGTILTISFNNNQPKNMAA